MSTILNNQIQPVSETHLFSLAMTSVLSHWLTTKPFVLSLYKCDTTRTVGRVVNSTAIHTSLFISLKTIPPGHIIKYSSSPLNIPQYPLTACISLIPHIYLHSLHLINPLAYTYTAYISLIPYIYLRSLHLINPPHIPTQFSSY